MAHSSTKAKPLRIAAALLSPVVFAAIFVSSRHIGGPHLDVLGAVVALSVGFFSLLTAFPSGIVRWIVAIGYLPIAFLVYGFVGLVTSCAYGHCL